MPTTIIGMIFKAVLEVFKQGVYWFWSFIIAFPHQALDSSLSGLSGYITVLFPSVDITVILPYINALNAWLPVSEGFLIFSGYMVTLLLVGSIRWIRAFIPFL